MDKDIFKPLQAFGYLGEKQLNDGTILIGKAPHIAQHAWLHHIYAPLGKVDINALEKNLGTSIPSDFKQFLEIANGLGVFNTTFFLYGLRRKLGRSIDAVWQPFNIITPNARERPANAKRSFFFIGSYDWDGSLLYIDSTTNRIHLCGRADATSVFSWVNFEQMLKSEIERLIPLFDRSGKELNADKTTLPI